MKFELKIYVHKKYKHYDSVCRLTYEKARFVVLHNHNIIYLQTNAKQRDAFSRNFGFCVKYLYSNSVVAVNKKIPDFSGIEFTLL